MFTDIVGYTALTQTDEAHTLEVLQRHNQLLRDFFPKFHGREVKTIGDSFLIEFDSALDAIECAVEIQKFLHHDNIATNDTWKIKLRIGIHLGDVVKKENNDIFGDAVNIASRLQPLAEPEGVCISEQVYYQVRNKLNQVNFLKMEPRDLKGVSFPVVAYKVVMPWEQQQVASHQRDIESKNRIAVLPFANMSPDPNDEYFADGMTEELIDRLAQMKQLRVIARTSVMSYKKKDKKAGEIAKELLVDSLVEGSIRKAGNRIRVTVQLIGGGTEEHLWSSHYDGSLDDIFAVQSEIAEKVAGELKVQLLQSEKNTIEKKPTENMEAYANFLRGIELFREGSEQSLREALKLFEKAAEIDPSFARAYVGMAECHQYLSGGGFESVDVMFPAVRSLLKRALELDSDLADAHASLAILHANEDDIRGMEAEARKALELNPSLPDPYRMMYELAGIRGNLEEMVRNAEISYRLDPVRPSHIALLGQSYLYAGKEQEALEHFRKTEHLAPAYTYRNMTDYYLSKGDLVKAREMHAKIEKMQPTNPWVVYMGGYIDAIAGNREKALEAIKKTEEAKMGPIALNFVAYIYCALGDWDRYFEYMERAADEHTIITSFVMYSPLLTKARADPRYNKLVDKVRAMQK
jgi:adenylate cyclase